MASSIIQRSEAWLTALIPSRLGLCNDNHIIMSLLFYLVCSKVFLGLCWIDKMCSKQCTFCHDSIMAADYQEDLQEKGPFHKDEIRVAFSCYRINQWDSYVNGWPFKFVTVKDAWSKPAVSSHSKGALLSLCACLSWLFSNKE